MQINEYLFSNGNGNCSTIISLMVMVIDIEIFGNNGNCNLMELFWKVIVNVIITKHK